MPLTDPELWRRIDGRRLPSRPVQDDTRTPAMVCASFADNLRLADGWTDQSAARLEAEYRRYLYLVRVVREPISPPPLLEGVFLRHMDVGAGYALRVAPGITRGITAIHEMPVGERSRRYGRARAAYKGEFDQEPPRDIWPSGWAAGFHRLVDRHWDWILGGVFIALCAPMAVGMLASFGATFLPGRLGMLGREIEAGDRAFAFPFVLFGVGFVALLALDLLSKLAPLRPPKLDDP